MKNKKGFTLIELMIVVAIIGILAALAIPDFMKMMAKSKQSEARTNLKAIFTCQKSYHGLENTYGNTFSLVDWEPEGQNLYNYFLGEAGTPEIAAKKGDLTSCITTSIGVGVDNMGYTAAATANIDSDESCDEWRGNDDNIINADTDDVKEG